MNKVKVGILGGAGYTGGELIRVLIHHPYVDIVFVHSKSHAGDFLHEAHTDLFGDTLLKFVDVIDETIDVLFLCVGHGESKNIIPNINPKIKIIDLSQDFRITSNTHSFIYGLPELNKEQLKQANQISNPGCFATAIQLALLPLAKHNLLCSDIHISATTGSTGAGQSLSESSHFSWRQNNVSVYKPFVHQHLAEIKQSLLHLQESFNQDIVFIPQRGTFTRGIFACLTLKSDNSIDELINLYSMYYQNHPFVHISNTLIDLKQVINTNKCLLYLEKNNNQLMIVSVIDNLLKGASGQAIQNMNLMFGLEETIGLQLKASAF